MKERGCITYGKMKREKRDEGGKQDELNLDVRKEKGHRNKKSGMKMTQCAHGNERLFSVRQFISLRNYCVIV